MGMLARLFKAIYSLDEQIFKACGVAVRFWCEWTGKSNFALARLLGWVALLLEVPVAIYVFRINLENKISDGMGMILLIALAMGGFAGMILWLVIPDIEKATDRAEGMGMISGEMKNWQVVSRFPRICFLFIIPVGIIKLYAENSVLIGFTFGGACLEVVVFHVVNHYNFGGRSKLEEKAKSFATKFIPAKSAPGTAVN